MNAADAMLVGDLISYCKRKGIDASKLTPRTSSKFWAAYYADLGARIKGVIFERKGMLDVLKFSIQQNEAE